MKSNTETKPKRKIPMPVELAAAKNLSPFFFLTLERLGFEVVIVRFQAGHDSPIWNHERIEVDLEKELRTIKSGEFDSSHFALGAQYHFFHIYRDKLGAAMQQLKTALDSRRLLPFTTLLHAETSTELREWYPGENAALIQIDEEND